MAFVTMVQDGHFWVGVALAVFFIILWRTRIFGAMGDALDAAGEKVRAQLDEAARLRQEAAEVLSEIKRQKEQTERTGQDMIQAAQSEAERLRALAAKELEEDIRRRGTLAERRIAAAEARAAADVKGAAADLAAELAQAVLSARLAAAKTDPLFDAGLEDLSRRFS
ncbi:MAG: ATP F0F1 synthase subunit B [Caulobacteraceae bacterium]